jgi:uncharacterized protein (DUF3820 family)
MKTIQYLEGRDVIQRGDYCRPLSLVYEGQSDYLQTTNPYGGGPMNNTKWLQVERAGMDAWIGKEVGAFNRAMGGLGKPHQGTTLYEFVRGELPGHAIHPETEPERALRLAREVNNAVMPCGKYKGKHVGYVYRHDPSYFNWAKQAGLISEHTDPVLVQLNAPNPHAEGAC